MSQLRKGATIPKLKSMKKFKYPVKRLLEIKEALVLLSKNDKIPIIQIMSFNEIKQEIQPYLETYSESLATLEKRLAEKGEDAEGTEIDILPPNKTLEYNDEKKTLLEAEKEVKLPTFKITDLGYDPKKPGTNKYAIPPGAIMGLGELVIR